MSAATSFNWTAALLLFAILLLGNSDTQLVSPLLPLIAEDLATTPGRAGLIVSSYSIAAAMFALLVGPLSDRAGRKPILVAGLMAFSAASLVTHVTEDFSTLVIARMATGLAAGGLSTSALSYAADFYPYAQRGRAMGVLSMAYSFAFVIGVPAGSILAAMLGWRSVFLALAALGALLAIATLSGLPADRGRRDAASTLRGSVQFFRRTDTLAGIAAAFLTSGGIVGFLTYLGAWLRSAHGVTVDRVGLLFIASGVAATAAAPVAGWLSDHLGKRTLVISANLVLAPMFFAVTQTAWAIPMILAIAILSIAASARQGPLHALTSELVPSESRGAYIAVRNAASQLGIAAVAAASSGLFDALGFSAVALLAGGLTVLIPIMCAWMREPAGSRRR